MVSSNSLLDAEAIALPRRLAPRPRADPFTGTVIAIDTEGSASTGTYSATAKDDDGVAQRFRDPTAFAEYLITTVAVSHGPAPLIYCHNLEWDLQVLWVWLQDTPLRYVGHSARRNGSALVATFDYDGRSGHKPRIVIRDSFAIFPMSLAQLGHVVGIPKLRTPREYIPKVVAYDSGILTDNHSYDDASAVTCVHDKLECLDCYDLRDVDILHAAMRLYVEECALAGLKPAYTRSAHAMNDFRTNYLPDALVQYTEKQNARAALARYGGRVQMLETGLTVAPDDHVIVQADVKAQYPSVMIRGGFPDAAHHVTLNRPRAERVREYIGFAWADVNVPVMSLGPLIYRHPETGRISYPTGCRLQAAWTTDELAYALDCGCTINELVRLEGTPTELALDPFSEFVTHKYALRAEQKAAGNPMQESTKLNMNGLSGKFGMRWMEERLEFIACDPTAGADHNPPVYCTRIPAPPKRYPEYIMMPWSALIMARGRIVLHRAGALFERLGARLLCCDTDSWTMQVPRTLLTNHGEAFGHELGDWEIEGEYHAFRGNAPKEYALYDTADALFRQLPTKGRAKGVSADGDNRYRMRAVDHYLHGLTVHFSRPHKTLSVLRGAPAATFQPMHKSARPRLAPDMPYRYFDFRASVRAMIREAEANTLRAQREEKERAAGAVPAALPWEGVRCAP